MSAPDNPAHDPNMDAEAVVATSLKTLSTERSSEQELTLNFEGPSTGIIGQSGSSTDKVNDSSDASDQVPGLPLSSAASSVELNDQDSGISQTAAGTDQEQSDPVNMSTPSDHGTQALNQEPTPPRSPEHDRNEEPVPKNSTVVERETESKATDKTARLSASVNVPPHMRPGFVAPVPYYSEPVQSRVSRNRTARGNSLPQGHRSNNSQHDSAEIVRLNAQILKIRDDLAAERAKNLTQRQEIKSQERHNLVVAFSDMVDNLLHDQITAVARKASVEARERDVLFREHRAAQLEIFLAEGQRQLAYGVDARHMYEVQLDHMRREMDLEMRKDLADREAEVTVKIEELRLRVSAQEKREELYKIMVTEPMKAEIKKNKLAAESEYKRGLKDGMEAGEQKFLKGYHACHRAQAALSMLRKGEMARDDPELDFLFDPAHAANTFNMALQIGRLGLHEATESEASAVEARLRAPEAEPNRRSEVTVTNADTIEEATEDAVDQSTVGMSYTAPAFAGHGRIPSRSQYSYSRPTLAAELRGPSLTYNGQIILANNDALRTLAPEATVDSAVQNNNNHVGPNLIDLL